MAGRGMRDRRKSRGIRMEGGGEEREAGEGGGGLERYGSYRSKGPSKKG